MDDKNPLQFAAKADKPAEVLDSAFEPGGRTTVEGDQILLSAKWARQLVTQQVSNLLITKNLYFKVIILI